MGGVSVATGSVSVSVRGVAQRATVAAVVSVAATRAVAAAVAAVAAVASVAGTPVAAIVGRSGVGAVSRRVSVSAESTASRDNSHQGSQTQQLQKENSTGYLRCIFIYYLQYFFSTDLI